MTIPDPYADEPTAELDENLWAAFVAARDEAAGWTRKADELKNALILSLGDAHAGLVAGRKVVSFRPKRQWAEAQLVRQYPDLAQHYMRPKVTEVFDLPAFMLVHPDIAEQFRVRAFKLEVEK